MVIDDIIASIQVVPPPTVLDIQAALEQAQAAYEETWPRRTILCNPAQEDAIRAEVERIGARRVTIASGPGVPDGNMYVIDEEAIEAANQEALSRPMRLY